MSESNSKGFVATHCVCCGSCKLSKSPAVLMPFVAHRALGWVPIEITPEWGLKTIQTGMAYSICNSVLCNNCHHLFSDIRFSEMEMGALYQGYREEEYMVLREKYEPGYKERNEKLNDTIDYLPKIEKFLSRYLTFPIRILDWGGDTGKNTPFKTCNTEFHIYDISDKEMVCGAKRIEKAIATKNQYDLVVCSNVLEHVPYPIEVVTDIKKSMGSDSLLYVEVPLEEVVRVNDAKTALVKKKHWHEHINFFTGKSISALFTQADLSIIDAQELEVIVGGQLVYVYMIAAKLKPFFESNESDTQTC
ncbi:Methyltransferase domain-containing protein [Gammaproteobacteria bacterium]